MDEAVLKTDSLTLFRQRAGRWRVYRFEGAGTTDREDLLKILEALIQSVEADDGPVCVVPGDLHTPNSRILATLIGLLVAKDGSDRHIALAGPTQAWIDMLDILGVRARFLVVDDVEDLKSRS
ncbi:MAG: hypothetical protein ACYSU0_15575 [Planctomycetota bacterium]|jgi:hypothetical protein